MAFFITREARDTAYSSLKVAIASAGTAVVLVGLMAALGDILNDKKGTGLGLVTSGALLAGLPAGAALLSHRKSLVELLENYEKVTSEYDGFIQSHEKEIRDWDVRYRILTEEQKGLEVELSNSLAAKSRLEHETISAQNQIVELELSLDQIPQLKQSLGEARAQLHQFQEGYQERFNTEFGRAVAAKQSELNIVLADNRAKQALHIAQIEERHNEKIKGIRDELTEKLTEQFADAYSSQLDGLHNALRDLQEERDQAIANLERCERESLDQNDLLQMLQNQRGELETAAEQIIQLTQQNAQLGEARVLLSRRLAVATKPRTFPTNEFYAAGNLIIKRCYEHHKLVLDGIYRKGDSERQTYSFHYRHTDPNSQAKPLGQVVSTINADLEYLKQLLDVQELGEFHYDAQELLIKTSVVKQFAKLSRGDVERHWESKSKFNKLAIQNHRFRITGASHAAKSPTARNILGAKLAAGQRFKIYRFDPSGGSEKDFWRVAPNWIDYSEAKYVAQRITDVVAKRKGSPCNELDYIYFILDEIDNTMAQVEPQIAKDYAAAIKTIFKEGDHLRIGCIVSGQSPMASNYPNFHRADFNNCTNIHIGTNIKDYILNSNEVSGTTQLALSYDKLYRYCDQQNEAISQESKKFRFALIAVPEKPLYFQELPFLGANEFDADYGSAEYDFAWFDCSEFPDKITDLDSAHAHHKRAKSNKKASLNLSKKTMRETAALAVGMAGMVPVVNIEPEAANQSSISILERDNHAQGTGQGTAQNPPIGGTCPMCGQLSTSIKQRLDGGKIRYRCQDSSCSRKTFTIKSE